MSHSECESHVPHLARLVLFSYFDEIWHDDAYWPPTVERPLKFRIFENSRWTREGMEREGGENIPPVVKMTRINTVPH